MRRVLVIAAIAISCQQTTQRVVLTGNIVPGARLEREQGRLAGARVLSGVSMLLRLSPAKQAELDALLAAQHGKPALARIPLLSHLLFDR